jgi:hypothetical protein
MNTPQAEINRTFDPKLSYKFACHWLHHLRFNEQLTGNQILDRSRDMMNWLCANKVTHVWSTATAVSMVLANVSAEKAHAGADNQFLTFANILFFEHQTDLLAFRLRWGM